MPGKENIVLSLDIAGNPFLKEKNSETIFSMLKEISKECLIVVVTYNEKAAEEYGDKIVYMEDVRIIKEVEKGYKKNTHYFCKEN